MATFARCCGSSVNDIQPGNSAHPEEHTTIESATPHRETGESAIAHPEEHTSAAAIESATAGLTSFSLADSSSSSPFEYIAPSDLNSFSPSWTCAICLEAIQMEETAQIKGCEHAYCVNCILKWASYKENAWCPQCKLPFSSLYVSKSIDGRRSDYMVEESVCLLLRAPWFTSLPEVQEPPEEQDDYTYCDDQDYDEEYFYTSNVRLGNRRWGDSGYVRTGRREARPIEVRQVALDEASGSSGPGNKGKGRRARRAQKREAINNARV